jgi:sulfofructose kinase
MSVVCVGLAALDTILAVPRHPAPDDRVVATDVVVAGGGPAATAAVALARLGVPVTFVGSIGDDDAGTAIRRGLEDEGVDVSDLSVVPGARSPQSAVLVGGATRAIATFQGSAPPLELTERVRTRCLEADWVHVDHAGYAAASGLRAEVRLSVDAGNPIPELDLAGLGLYAPTDSALAERYPGLGIDDAARAAVAEGAALVVVTTGADGCVAATMGGELVSVPAPAVDPVSTLGAGDVFHGALLAGLVRELPLEEALADANAVAAASCTALDGRSAIPVRTRFEPGTGGAA